MFLSSVRARLRAALLLSAVLSVSTARCSCGASLDVDGGPQDLGSMSDGGHDGGADAGVDLGTDAGTDAGIDAGVDLGTDAGPDPMCSAAHPCSWHMATPSASPPVLAWAAMAYDTADARMILFGGASTISGGTIYDRTFAWNGITWNELTPAHHPSARWTHGMVYDEARGRIVLFGGQSDSGGSALADTWEWDGSDWMEITTAHAPSPRGVHGAMAYDPARHVVVVRGGGTLPGQTIFADTWEYDGTDWMEITATGPGDRVAPAMTYDRARGRMLLFGGGTWSPYFGDMWTWNGSAWSDVTPTTRPSDRQSARMVFDPTRSLVLLFGGDDGSLLNDLWEWDGTTWTPNPVAGPPPRCCYAFAQDTGRSETVLYGGPDDQTWVYGR